MTDAQPIAIVGCRVKIWAPEMRIVLTRKILETLEPLEVSHPPRRMSLERVFELLKTESPPPNEEECAKIVKGERLRKYG